MQGFAHNRGRANTIAATLAIAAAALLGPSAASAAEAKEYEYAVWADGVYKYSGVSDWKRQDTETCDITDHEEVEYTAKFSSGPTHVTVSSRGDLFSRDQLKTKVSLNSRDLMLYDHEPGVSPCGTDDDDEFVCDLTKPVPGTLTLADDVAAVNEPGVFDDYELAPGRLTLSGEVTRTEDKGCYPTMLWPVASNAYVQRPFLPYTTSVDSTKKLRKGAKEVELKGKRGLLESGTSGSDHSGTWHVGWSVRWTMEFHRIRVP